MEPTNGLFLDDDITQDQVAPSNTADVAMKMYQIKKTKERMEQLAVQAEEAAYFYEHKQKALEERIAWLENQISTWLSMNNLKNVQTHNGTAFFQRSVRYTLPQPDVLLGWVKAQPEPERFIRTKEEINITALKNYMKESGNVPPDYTEEEYSALRIRQAT